MSSPQVENGYTRIANELLEAIFQYRCSGAQKDSILAVIRATYGFHKKSRAISTAYLAKLTGRHPKKVASDVADLIRRKVLTEVRPYAARTCRTLALNKNFDEWARKDESTKSLTVNENVDSESMKSLTVSQRKRRPNKENILKKPLKAADSQNGSSAPNQPKESFEEKKDRGSPVREFQTWWAEEYKRRFGVGYLFNYGKDGKLVKSMLKVCDGNLEELKQKATTFLESSDHFTGQAGHTIGVFYTRFNGLREATKKPSNGEAKALVDSFSAMTVTEAVLLGEKR